MGSRPLTLGFRYLFLFGLYAASLLAARTSVAQAQAQASYAAGSPVPLPLPSLASVLQAASTLYPALIYQRAPKKPHTWAAVVGLFLRTCAISLP